MLSAHQLNQVHEISKRILWIELPSFVPLFRRPEIEEEEPPEELHQAW